MTGGSRAETAARWLLALPPESSAAVVERLSRETLEEIREALRRLGEPASEDRVPADESPENDDDLVIDPDSLDAEPTFLLAAIVAAAPTAARDDLRAAIAARRGPEVLATIDAFGPVTPAPAAVAAIRDHAEGRT